MSRGTKVKVVVPFRDRGVDQHRAANLDVVMAWWWAHGFTPVIVDDGGEGEEQFNRHRAYNKAVDEFPETDVFVFAEADMIIHPSQIIDAVRMADAQLGLVVPFSQYRYLSETSTEVLRESYAKLSPETVAQWWAEPIKSDTSIFRWEPKKIMDNGKSIGAVNVVSAKTLDVTGGFTEATTGNWYDDNIIEEGFAFLTRPTRLVKGPAVHMYHLPGHSGEHITDEDRAATESNKSLLEIMRLNIRNNNTLAVRALMSHRVKEK